MAHSKPADPQAEEGRTRRLTTAQLLMSDLVMRSRQLVAGSGSPGRSPSA
jgi:hypothetical protein